MTALAYAHFRPSPTRMVRGVRVAQTRASYGLVDGDRSVATSTHQQPREHTAVLMGEEDGEPDPASQMSLGERSL